MFMIMALNVVLFPSSLLMISSLLLPVIATASSEGYSPKYDLEKPNASKDNLLSTIIAIQGLVYCKSGSNLIPLEGAVTSITCLSVDEQGFETAPYTILSNACNPKGYFFTTLSPAEVPYGRKLKECRGAFLELSPSDPCNFPTDVNKGIAGALLGYFRPLEDKKIRLYTVGPFFFTPQPNSDSDGF